MKSAVYNLAGKSVGEIDLPESVFGRPWNPALVAQVLAAQVGNRRVPLAHTKVRGEVRGGGKKPWRQKGTGRARHGSIRSPIWKGGGVTHGPRKEKNFSKKINKKMRRAAISSILSRKLAEGEVRVVESLALDKPKTKILYQALSGFLAKPRRGGSLSSVLVPVRGDRNIPRAASNIPKVKSLQADTLNAYDLMTHKHVIIDRGAIPEFVKTKE